jgi:hypothetical protein
MLRITSIVLACLFFAFPASARQRHAATACVETGSPMFPTCMGQSNNPFSGARSIHVVMKRERTPRTSQHVAISLPAARPLREPVRAETAVVEHPAGCPARAFCGCGAAVRVFGHSVRELWLAANWFKFPRAEPAPGMVAVRRHHVMVLEADLGGGVWKVYDANSGRHLTRVHARSIAGYAVVNPRA